MPAFKNEIASKNKVFSIPLEAAMFKEGVEFNGQGCNTQTPHGQGSDPQINTHVHISPSLYKANKIPCLSNTLHELWINFPV